MNGERILLDDKRMQLTISRLCHQLVEEYDDFRDVCLIGIQTKGVYFADRIFGYLRDDLGIEGVPYGKLDITFYRDDFRTRKEPLAANLTEMDFLVENKKVVLIDDVLYTGRTIQAALTAINHYGRPKSVELLVLVNRRFNRHLPIAPDFSGITIDSLDEAYVEVNWQQLTGRDQVILHPKKDNLI